VSCGHVGLSKAILSSFVVLFIVYFILHRKSLHLTLNDKFVAFNILRILDCWRIDHRFINLMTHYMAMCLCLCGFIFFNSLSVSVLLVFCLLEFV
jgi:hypothetical protein